MTGKDLDWSVPGVRENTREVMNWGLRKAVEELNAARDPKAEWGPSAEPRTVLCRIRAARRFLEDAEKWAVAEMRADDCSWTEIGVAIGVTKQAAWERFGK